MLIIYRLELGLLIEVFQSNACVYIAKFQLYAMLANFANFMMLGIVVWFNMTDNRPTTETCLLFIQSLLGVGIRYTYMYKAAALYLLYVNLNIKIHTNNFINWKFN